MNIHRYIDEYVGRYVSRCINECIGRYVSRCINECIGRCIIMKIHNKHLIALIKRERIVTSSEVAEKFSVSWNTAEKYLMELALDGRVERIKKVGVNLWMLK